MPFSPFRLPYLKTYIKFQVDRDTALCYTGPILLRKRKAAP